MSILVHRRPHCDCAISADPSPVKKPHQPRNLSKIITALVLLSLLYLTCQISLQSQLSSPKEASLSKPLPETPSFPLQLSYPSRWTNGVIFSGGPGFESCNSTVTTWQKGLFPSGAMFIVECKIHGTPILNLCKQKLIKGNFLQFLGCLASEEVHLSSENKTGKLTLRKFFAKPTEAHKAALSLKDLPYRYSSIIQFLLSTYPDIKTG